METGETTFAVQLVPSKTASIAIKTFFAIISKLFETCDE